MKIEATVVLPVKVSVEIPGPLDGLENIHVKDLQEIWKIWKIKLIRRLFAEAELTFKRAPPLAKISNCSLAELEGEVNIYTEDEDSSIEEELPPTVKATR